MEFSISPLTQENPYYEDFLRHAREQGQWNNVFALETLPFWRKAFASHIQPFLVTIGDPPTGFIPMFEKKGILFPAISDLLFSDGPCGMWCSEGFFSAFQHLPYSFWLHSGLSFPHHTPRITKEFFFVKTEGLSFETYFASLGWNWRKEIRAQRNKWKRENITLTQITLTPKECAHFFVLHRKRFGRTFYTTPEFITYAYALAQQKPEVLLWYELAKDTHPMGYVIWVKQGKCINSFSHVYDPQTKKLNPGKALIYLSLQHIFSLPGTFEINFGTDQGYYKEHWTDQVRERILYLPTNALQDHPFSVSQRNAEISHLEHGQTFQS